ncbi:hypothetical protein DIPPA_33288 [Diplonema papillatum]|nr:hypothetical protein DIPPA_33288 [Diplonema papillatum]
MEAEKFRLHAELKERPCDKGYKAGDSISFKDESGAWGQRHRGRPADLRHSHPARRPNASRRPTATRRSPPATAAQPRQRETVFVHTIRKCFFSLTQERAFNVIYSKRHCLTACGAGQQTLVRTK